MTFSFFAPLLLGGIAFLAIPWWVHRIRRPERETLLFSSLIFVPTLHRKTIERQSLQHILLMILRMMALAAMALAFARPYFSWTAFAVPEGTSVRHLILLDVSGSMGAGNRMEEAKHQALYVLDSLGANDRVALAIFDRTLDLVVPFDTANGDSRSTRERIKQELSAIRVGFRSTAFLPVLQRAQEILLSDSLDQAIQPHSPKRFAIHGISDFQKMGMPDRASHWKLSPAIQFIPIDVGLQQILTATISDIGIRVMPTGDFRISGQIISNSAETESTCQVRLFVDETENEIRETMLTPNHSQKVTFPLSRTQEQLFSGWMEIDMNEGDDGGGLHRRYFAWNPPPHKPVWLIRQESDESNWPASWFLSRALRSAKRHNWEIIEKMPQGGVLGLSGDTRPERVVCCGMEGIDESAVAALLDYVQAGGGLWVLLESHLPEASPASGLLQKLGWQNKGIRYPSPSSSVFETFTWIDFEHPIFYPFRGSQFNDFTAIHFYNYLVLVPIPAAGGKSASESQILARFENSHPAVVETKYGEGQVLMWAFTPDLPSTNLPKSPRFIPLAIESLQNLSPPKEMQREFLVDEALSEIPCAPAGNPTWIVSLPGEETERMIDSETLRNHPIPFQKPGLVKIKPQNIADWQNLYAVNMDSREADLTPVPPEQFERAFISNPGEEILRTNEASIPENRSVKQSEWGHWLLWILLIGLIAETVYAAKLARKTQRTEAG